MSEAWTLETEQTYLSRYQCWEASVLGPYFPTLHPRVMLSPTHRVRPTVRVDTHCFLPGKKNCGIIEVVEHK